MLRPFRIARIAAVALWTSGLLSLACAQQAEPLTIPDAQLEPLRWSALDGWAADDHVASFAAFAKSCQPFRVLKEMPAEALLALQVALWRVCQRTATADDLG